VRAFPDVEIQIRGGGTQTLYSLYDAKNATCKVILMKHSSGGIGIKFICTLVINVKERRLPLLGPNQVSIWTLTCQVLQFVSYASSRFFLSTVTMDTTTSCITE
jgi:hypothetical protein